MSILICDTANKAMFVDSFMSAGDCIVSRDTEKLIETTYLGEPCLLGFVGCVYTAGLVAETLPTVDSPHGLAGLPLSGEMFNGYLMQMDGTFLMVTTPMMLIHKPLKLGRYLIDGCGTPFAVAALQALDIFTGADDIFYLKRMDAVMQAVTEADPFCGGSIRVGYFGNGKPVIETL